jgi:hypothetical protein
MTNRLLKITASCICLILLASSVMADSWGYTGWAYRKSHIINSATNAGTNYQVMITVYYTNGTDGAGNVYCNGKCKTDFGDIRFTASDGSTPLSYWIQSSSAGTSAVFWVKVTDDLSTSAQTIFMYYGSSGSSIGSGTGTFIYYDDGSSLSGWTQSDATYTGMSTTVGNPANSLYARSHASGDQYYMYRNVGLGANTFTSFNVMTNNAANLGDFYYLCNASGAGQMYRLDARGAANYTGFATTTSWHVWNPPGASQTSSPNTWYRFGIAINSAATSSTLYYDATTSNNPVPGTVLNSTTYAVTNNGGYIGLGGDQVVAYTYYTYWDNIITRKYVSPEPAQSTWGTEQPMILATSGTDASCYRKPDGTATVTYTGGSSVASYSWNSQPPQTTQTATGLPAGTYTVTVTDALGHSAQASYTVGQPTAVTATANPLVNISCYNGNDGKITITAGGGTPGYSFSINDGSSWTAGSTPYTFENLVAGSTYKIRVMDSKGCKSPAIPNN